MKIDVKEKETVQLTAADIGTIRTMLKLAKKQGHPTLEKVKEHFRMYTSQYSVFQSANMALFDWDCETIQDVF